MSNDPQNPYSAPNFTDSAQMGVPPNSPINPGILTQQRVISILMIVNGSLLLVMGALLLVFAFVMPAMIDADMKRNGNPPPFKDMQLFMTLIYGGMGFVAGLIPGGLQVFAGIKNLQLKGRTLAIVAISTGLLTLLNCYCFPTSLALFIYGLIILLNESCTRAYELGEKGYSYDDVMRVALGTKTL